MTKKLKTITMQAVAMVVVALAFSFLSGLTAQYGFQWMPNWAFWGLHGLALVAGGWGSWYLIRRV